jgi:hypothetical protein
MRNRNERCGLIGLPVGMQVKEREVLRYQFSVWFLKSCFNQDLVLV